MNASSAMRAVYGLGEMIPYERKVASKGSWSCEGNRLDAVRSDFRLKPVMPYFQVQSLVAIAPVSCCIAPVSSSCLSETLV